MYLTVVTVTVMLSAKQPVQLPPSLPQVLEDNRNQLETKGVQLVANKEQLQLMGLQLEGRGQEVTALKQRVAGLERMVAGSLKGLMLQGQDAETNVSPFCFVSPGRHSCFQFVKKR